jgi:hypothetical protein
MVTGGVAIHEMRMRECDVVLTSHKESAMSTLSLHGSPAVRQDRPDAHLDRVLRRLVLTGMALVLLVPLARASTDWLGWLPLWLVGMPAVAWWALHRFRLPAGGRLSRVVRRRRSPQARRVRGLPSGLPRAA